ncbi:hypothetical protein N658DRAFT_488413 [Parathielavia hyrcaniae]|uniref:Uncharacterized protein n=1 Tax=Parathielavia hyrcaniae TaxID=113614 RepID=A0AAN6PV62_9PEZI|nr:hypothetical protein N658DRAFT_488413 [Parathielavia hyrcaniae]
MYPSVGVSTQLSLVAYAARRPWPHPPSEPIRLFARARRDELALSALVAADTSEASPGRGRPVGESALNPAAVGTNLCLLPARSRPRMIIAMGEGEGKEHDGTSRPGGPRARHPAPVTGRHSPDI